MEKIVLTDELFLGDGNHKIVYAHPTDRHRCVKLLRTPDDPDFAKEMRYRKALGDRADSMTLLTKYFGEVDTNRGTGYVFERVIDFDGKSSPTMLNVLADAFVYRDLIPETENLLLDFKREYFAERFLLAGVDPDNYLVQKISPTARRVRIIDNIGIATFVPLAYWFDSFALKRAKKYWRRFSDLMRSDYGKIFSNEFLDKLAEV